MKIRSKIILSLVVVLTTIVVGDLLCQRLFWYHIYYRPHEMLLQQHPTFKELLRYKPSQKFTGTITGDLAAMAGNPQASIKRDIEFQTDQHGFRNDPHNKGPFDVIALGDSFGVGNGTTQSQTWATSLGAYNLSMQGSPWQSFMNFKLEYPRIPMSDDATLIFMIFSGNDLEEYYGPSTDPQKLFKEKWNKKAYRKLKSFLNRSYFANQIKKISKKQINTKIVKREFLDGKPFLFYGPHIPILNLDENEINKLSKFQYLKIILTELKTICTDKKINLMVALVPTKTHVYEWVLHKRDPWENQVQEIGFFTALKKWTRENNIATTDLSPTLIEQTKEVYKSSGNVLWWHDDSHINSLGHKVVADQLRKVIREY